MESYSAQYSTLVRKLETAKTRMQRVANPAPIRFWDLLSAFFLRQSSYLLWSVTVIALQLLEVLTLAWVHFIYFPPESLILLRASSSFLCGTICFSAGVRVYLSQRTKRSQVQYRGGLEALSHLVFWFGTACSTVAILWILFGTFLHLNSPPIFRAVMLGTLLVLPFDMLSTFQLYNARFLALSPPERSTRLLALALNFLGLLLIALDLPLIYLLARLAPRFILLSSTFRMMKSSPLRLLYFPRIVPHLLELASSGLLPLFVVFTLEVSLFLSLNAFTRVQEDISVLVFLAHKLVHFGMILSVKSILEWYPRISKAKRRRDAKLLTLLSRRFFIVCAICAGTAMLFTPVVMLKHDVLLWISPTGDYLEVSSLLLLVLALLIFFRTFSFALTTLAILSANQTRLKISLIAVSVFSVIIAQQFSELVSLSWDESIIISQIFDCTLFLLLAIVCAKDLLDTKRENVVPRKAGLFELIERTHGEGEQALIYLKRLPRVPLPLSFEQYLEREKAVAVPWGKYGSLIICPKQEAAEEVFKLMSPLLRQFWVGSSNHNLELSIRNLFSPFLPSLKKQAKRKSIPPDQGLRWLFESAFSKRIRLPEKLMEHALIPFLESLIKAQNQPKRHRRLRPETAPAQPAQLTRLAHC